MKKTLLLRKSDIKNLIDMNDILKAVEKAFKEYALGKVQMPPKSYLFFPEGDFRIMPSYLEYSQVAGVKCVNSHPKNPKKYSLPTVMAIIELIDPTDGFPLTIMDGTWITDMRTGAAGGISAKYLARPDSKKLGIIGAGRQARTQLMAIKNVLDIEEVTVYCRTPSAREKFAKETSKKYNIDVKPAKTAREAVKGKDIIVTATPSTKPVIELEWTPPGVHICAIGADAPGKQELDPRILIEGRIFVDSWEQASHSGEINVPLREGIISKEDIKGTLGQVIIGEVPGRTSEDEITIFDSTGLSVQDMATASLIYERALKEKRGIPINFMG
ncbi:MAG TPA: alanine dehydrogenase [Methanothermobacter sp.]|nr:alanine dehydrogenase [Methanothermobacter sp. MT-2]HHW04747.1 alanine dehydrogenase [Methanothermobacter sp.]HOK72241.1 alanine dehydrogenase [Methanothermobacter sp.]HOL68958.1 alanine dehydrogenase [Methanothermobacter sp.]HPQ04903.1 alanine dehydrogenase [Methanothermobacter sp.]